MRYINITRSADLPDISSFAPFKAILAVEDPVDRERQIEISNWLVAMGCRYVMPCGKGSESWCETVRDANTKAFDPETLEARDFVMTTSHTGESLKSVFWFSKNAANHPEVVFTGTVVIHLAETDRSVEYQAAYQKA